MFRHLNRFERSLIIMRDLESRFEIQFWNSGSSAIPGKDSIRFLPCKLYIHLCICEIPVMQ